jgi:hypothetical protein
MEMPSQRVTNGPDIFFNMFQKAVTPRCVEYLRDPHPGIHSGRAARVPFNPETGYVLM